jgi:hypothetical protein
VTEAEWGDCIDPQRMLTFLHGKLSDRKMRLFAVACCRRVWGSLTDERGRRAVEVSEAYADGGASREELMAAVAAAGQAPYAARQAAHPVVRAFAAEVAEAAAALGGTGSSEDPRIDHAVELAFQSALLHDLVGSPFRPLPAVNPAWLAWEGGTVPRLAADAYEERAFDRLPILADALEDAGCTDPDLLGHLRGPGPHVRGCWVLDLLLGKS